MVENIKQMWAVSPLLVVIVAALSILMCSQNDTLKVAALEVAALVMTTETIRCK
jgi:hypothetical protein